ncbi:glutathionylspermidine synthase family protein [Paenibacillus gansuensis]|uniref:Glutathionylspermidine synthase family protein n=1 Tax=Paenibacillus gansuensis TaxID=306542 RepID=A0ABW5P7J8_9BACL
MTKGRIVNLPVPYDAAFAGERGERIPYYRMYGKPYCLPSLTVYTVSEVERLQEAAERVDQVYNKVLLFVQRELPDVFLVKVLGLRPDMLSAARIEVPYHGVSRQDWILTPAGELKCIENNTDTPTGIPEAAWLAGSFIQDCPQYRNLSAGMDGLIRDAFAALIRYYREQGTEGDVVFSSYGWHEEDSANAKYLLEQVKEAGVEARFAPLEEIEIVPGEGLYHDDKRIGIWYRLYPLEYLADDQDDQGNPIGSEVFRLVQDGLLAVINPVQSLITQSKGFMALIWSLYEKQQAVTELMGTEEAVLDAADMETIRRYLLPTYTTPQPFLDRSIPFVSKGYWGREGKGTVLHDAAGSEEIVEKGNTDPEEAEEITSYYAQQPKIYQHRIPMEAIAADSGEGTVQGYLLTGVYVIGHRFAGILPRVGGLITGDLACFCPAAVRDEQ